MFSRLALNHARRIHARPELKPIVLNNYNAGFTRVFFAGLVFSSSAFFGVWLSSTGAMMMEKYNLYTPDNDDDD